jgi:hypothetical protein
MTENRIARNQLKGFLRLVDGERMAIAEIGKRLGEKVLGEVANIVKLNCFSMAPQTHCPQV